MGFFQILQENSNSPKQPVAVVALSWGPNKMFVHKTLTPERICFVSGERSGFAQIFKETADPANFEIWPLVLQKLGGFRGLVDIQLDERLFWL
jgi:hypothetical protein